MQVWYRSRWDRETDIYTVTLLSQLTDSTQPMLYLGKGMHFILHSFNAVPFPPFRRKPDPFLFLPHPLHTILQLGGSVTGSCTCCSSGAHPTPFLPPKVLGHRSAELSLQSYHRKKEKKASGAANPCAPGSVTMPLLAGKGAAVACAGSQPCTSALAPLPPARRMCHSNRRD